MEREKINTEYMLKVVDIKSIQQIQDFLADALNISLVGIYNGKLFTIPSNTKRYFLDICLKTNNNKLNFLKYAQLLENCVLTNKGPIIKKNAAGIMCFCLPIFTNKQYFCSLVGGQFLTEKPDLNYFKIIAQQFLFDEKEYFSQIKKLPIYTNEKASSMVNSLSLITNALADIFYADKQLKKMGIRYDLSNSAILGEWFLKNYNTDKRTITEREFEVLKLIAQGKNNSEIAKALCISVHTAKAHVSSIIEKFSAEDRVQVAVQAVREGLI